MLIFLLIIYIKCQISYSQIKKNCLQKIESNMDSFKFFEIETFNLDIIKKKYRELSLNCHPDRTFILYKSNLTDKEKNIINENMIIINDHFVRLKSLNKIDKKKEVRKSQVKKYNKFSLKRRFDFKLKRYTYLIVGTFIIILCTISKKFRRILKLLIFTCFVIIIIYIFRIKGLIFIFIFLSVYLFCTK